MSDYVVEDRGFESPCWIWQRSMQSTGYGRIWMGGRGGRHYPAHRVYYERFVGPIPDGLQIDHLCRVPPCVNPDHLEPVTQRENVLRGVSTFAQKAAQTHCVWGHEFTPENTGYRSDNGTRWCRVCKRVRDRAYHERKKAKRP